MLGYAARGSNYPDALELMETLFSLCKEAGLHKLCARPRNEQASFTYPGDVLLLTK
jgi:hypothetical protein